LKVVNISISISGGAGRAAYRLHQSLLNTNVVESSFVSFDKSFPKDAVNCNTYTYNPPLYKKLVNKLIKVFKNDAANKRLLIEKEYNKIVNDLQCEITSLPFGQQHLLSQPAVKNADIINLHWVSGGLLDYDQFFKNCDKPVVWTLHDMNPFLGIFHYQQDEDNNIIANDLDTKVKEFKKKVMDKMQAPFEIITPSDWLSDEAKKSDRFKKLNVSTISNSLDHNVFYFKKNNAVKSNLGIDTERIVFCFIAQSIDIPRKGFQLLYEALKQIEKPVTIIAIGDLPDKLDWSGIDIQFVGPVNDNNKLADFYSAADAVVLPSIEDNLPNVMLEALACGTPIVGFPIGGVKQYVINDKTGILAKEVSVSALANAIEEFVEKKNNFSRTVISDFAKEYFSDDLQSSSYLAVYKRLLNKQ
jgi:glycosyltransferase involved in cell wall biosynthesis